MADRKTVHTKQEELLPQASQAEAAFVAEHASRELLLYGTARQTPLCAPKDAAPARTQDDLPAPVGVIMKKPSSLEPGFFCP
ncbi:hypothetical protein [Gorillibacterium sp. CAU 1737]|uniref:hypothetical protein n=1 Tax=Gorillibacterium sp. CAU 1737 TaxID=3140362 RepID=UPI00326058EE